eukprot:scaffold164654_cov49-Prasinocladus_malaysianus.AAC.1
MSLEIMIPAAKNVMMLRRCCLPDDDSGRDYIPVRGSSARSLRVGSARSPSARGFRTGDGLFSNRSGSRPGTAQSSPFIGPLAPVSDNIEVRAAAEPSPCHWTISVSCAEAKNSLMAKREHNKDQGVY